MYGREERKVGPLEEYVREFSVEDPDRYERLTKTQIEREQLESPRGELQRRSWTVVNGAPLVTIISCVLEVPRPQTERVLTILRSTPHVRSAAYLPACSSHADEASKAQDEAVALRAQIKALERALRHIAVTRDFHALEGGEPYVGETFAEISEVMIKEARRHGGETASRIRAALNERKTDVAAKLLAALPEDPFE